ncbi:hypothetical protein Sp245p_22925 (plasmid) [Azospirillum baldaniorum]|uniref:Uncharacterized protein n=1 Tax=Azospirillum baldaniorum TaxID=1064539 RepID=A0A9P1JZJ2_9PROT|nr:hypothetical protein [Azospirillum baldaniorum]AWJ92705.1 hypothetical protein Sp245p_22925 [Azospirillum baldaniorum]CCD02769.1 protein of unknown function [Azospirillum baldaniorum]
MAATADAKTGVERSGPAHQVTAMERSAGVYVSSDRIGVPAPNATGEISGLVRFASNPGFPKGQWR